MKNAELWNRLQAFTFDADGAAFPFSKRLASENGWSLGYAERVLEEYRRFLYLGVCAGHPITPSDEVDQAWHLHMVYTRSYWEDLCGEVLGKPFHHGPTRGGNDEREKFHDWYDKTLSTYATEFGEAPPPDIWPAADRRFSNQFQRINKRENLVISKKSVRRAATATLAAAGAVSLASCAASGSEVPMVILAMLGGFVVVCILMLITRGGGGGGGKGGGGGSCGGGCGFGGTGRGNDDDGDSGCGGGGCGGCGGD